MAAKARSDIANTAVRIFLQDFGAEYDTLRGKEKYAKAKHLPEIAEFFGNRCCYCGMEFELGQPAVQDHLVPLNRTNLGLHAWGNIVPSCGPCITSRGGGTGPTFSGFTHRANVADLESDQFVLTTEGTTRLEAVRRAREQWQAQESASESHPEPTQAPLALQNVKTEQIGKLRQQGIHLIWSAPDEAESQSGWMVEVYDDANNLLDLAVHKDPEDALLTIIENLVPRED